MLERLALTLAHQVKALNAEETESVEVLTFGFTIILHYLFTLLLVLAVGLLHGEIWLFLQIALSFTFMRVLTGGAHLDHSIGCTLLSVLFITAISWVPFANNYAWILYGISGGLLIWKYAPYYEAHQVVHTEHWERRKKRIAYILIVLFIILAMFMSAQGLVLGVLLQGGLLTPIGLKVTRQLNRFILKGGETNEENS
ncbi:accessory gene regulator B family protein [Halalkalibacterium halodurans]|uniref:accessory gene regulator AgrB n=1 Tax=Halalkalibacterium halodurans TaxID=86665 RepID=UPI002E200976|nr:accessory gene regulator B family protein [Halalkalibacterium halodurans]MED3646667.1 accessory gene regulator B family protein [Halalkalibacterium halodurans]